MSDLVGEFRRYLERFEALAGPGDYGMFVKHAGRLIKKLTYEEFEPKYYEYSEVMNAYQESLERGDTINDVVVRLVRERCDELVLERPIGV